MEEVIDDVEEVVWRPFIPSEGRDGVESGRGAGQSSEVDALIVGVSVGELKRREEGRR
jgi:hypothetical protein